MPEIRLKTTEATIGGITKSLLEWAHDYQITVFTMRTRYRLGLRGDDLIAPELDNLVTRNDIHKLWGGRWEYVRKHKIWNKYRENARWVYVGR